ncbi:MAG TPA: MBL fold metallo-hydrolase [Candidatus Dormibacteraeota bacterium]|nr:MBL fold metallo-hydrolase [Candidatus Dormibacteraeota bacterium]
MKRCFVVAALLFFPAACVAADDLFEIKPVGDGVYAAIAKPAYKVNCNAAIIILGESVLVVDTHSKPSAARALIEQIKKITPKPVKYVVNTHFHWDHYQGNEAYPSSWPAGIEIISSQATRMNIQRIGIPRVKHEIVAMPREIEQLKNDLEKASSSEQKQTIRKNLAQAEAYLAELNAMRITLPTMTFDRSLILHREARTVQILWLGRGHTDGDVYVFLPKEKVLVTGDAMHGWTPFMGDSFPYEWIQTLEAAEKLDFNYVIGGHGDVMQGKQKFQLWKEYFHDLLDRTAAAYAEGASLDEAKKRVSDFLVPKYADKFEPGFPQSVFGNIAKAYQVIAFPR